MRIQIQHSDKPAEMRDEVTEEEAQELADSGLVVLVAGRDGGFRQLEKTEKAEQPQQEPAAKKTPAAKVVNAVKKAVQKVVPAKKGKK